MLARAFGVVSVVQQTALACTLVLEVVRACEHANKTVSDSLGWIQERPGVVLGFGFGPASG